MNPEQQKSIRALTLYAAFSEAATLDMGRGMTMVRGA